ncbi:MAG TPA: transporter suffix domain-containing protein [Dongiaceae bacterium]|nr:transporter suffix domain-containing protein [Dongiaceae bacterium]
MTAKASKRKSLTLKIGITLLVLGTLLWLSVLVFPFLPLPVGVKVASGAVTAIVAETICWVGAFCIGKEVVVKYRHRFNPKNWRKSAKAEELSE